MRDIETATANLDAIMRWEDTEAADAALIATMQRRGHRDALIGRLARADRATRKMVLANLWEFTTRHAPVEMLSADALSNLIVTTSVLHWIEGDDAQALFMLTAVPEGHRMGDLLKLLVSNGVPVEVWLDGLRRLNESECLAYQG